MFDLLQTAPAPRREDCSQFLPMIFIFVIFYFLLIAPMRKKQKKTQEMLSKLKKGDEVITGGGIFGRITALDDERGFVILQIADNTEDQGAAQRDRRPRGRAGSNSESRQRLSREASVGARSLSRSAASSRRPNDS